MRIQIKRHGSMESYNQYSRRISSRGMYSKTPVAKSARLDEALSESQTEREPLRNRRSRLGDNNSRTE